MKSKSLILMVVSLGFGLIAAIGISQVMGRSGTAGPTIEMGPVVVSVDQLDHRTQLIAEENVIIETWPKRIIPEEACRSFEDVKDMAITTRINKKMPILKTDILHKTKLDNISIPPGFRVCAMKVSADDTVGGLLSPGDSVDVIGVFRVRDRESGDQKTISKTFLKNIRVFSIGNKMRSSENDRSENGNKNNAIVGVLVKQEQAEQISLVEKEGELKIIMRGQADEDETPPDSLDDILGKEADVAIAERPAEVERPAIVQPKRTRMKIWNSSGGFDEVFFDENNEPISTSAGEADSDSSESIGADEDEAAGPIENEGDYEEDQYPGE